MNNMGPRNLLILFFSTVAVSLVILIIFFSLFFKNVDLNFNAKLPESAPDLGTLYSAKEETMQSKAEGLLRSTINVPPEVREFVGNLTQSNADKAGADATDSNLPPVSDDVVFEETQDVASTNKATVAPSEGKAPSPKAPSVESSPQPAAENAGPPVPGQ